MPIAASPFERLYGSFELFASAARQRGRRLTEMSGGVNWINASPSVVDLLHKELESGLTYRNYGPSSGVTAVTDALEVVETKRCGTEFQPAVTVTNGTAEGAHLVFELLLASRSVQPGALALQIGHGYPLYCNLATKFGLRFSEIILDDNPNGYMPSMEQVIDRIHLSMPRLVFLIVPGNPVGETYSADELDILARACASVGAALVVDRVCLLPWDTAPIVSESIAALIDAGACFIVDSFAKSESLAGMRTGFIVSSAEQRSHLLHLTRDRCLNPIIFSTLTLALCRLAVLPEGGEQVGHSLFDLLRDQCPMPYSGPDPVETYSAFRTSYLRELAQREAIVRDNYNLLTKRLQSTATRPMRLDAGFNVAVTLPTMQLRNEASDQRRLAYEQGVAVLTEGCFRQSARHSGHYFVRASLAFPVDEFQSGLNAICGYFCVQ